MTSCERPPNYRPGIRVCKPDPFPTYTLLREQYPVCQIEPHGTWVLSRYQDIKDVMSQPEIFSSAAVDLLFKPEWLSEDCQKNYLIVTQDPPEHKKYHALLNRSFINSSIMRLVPLMRNTIKSLFENFGSGMPIDFVEQFSYPYIAKIARHIIGVGEKQSLSELRRWVECEERLTPFRPDEQTIKKIESAIRMQNSYFMQVIKERRQEPQDDLLSSLINAKVDNKPLDDKKICSLLSLLMSAGLTTMMQQLNHAVMQLAWRPKLRAQLTASSELIPLFAEELLRYCPSSHNALRMTKKDVDIAGVSIPRGTLIILFLASANRDPTVFESPDTFNIFRPNNKHHLTFGHGIHTCLGAALARLELKIAVEEILNAFESITCPEYNKIDWIEDSLAMSAVSSLPVSFS